jgi:uncharacterized protein
VHLSEIWRYPVKSCQGARLEEAAVDIYGIEGDRLFAIAPLDGDMLSQRAVPRLNLISVDQSKDRLHLGFPGRDPVTIDLSQDGTPVTVSMHGEMPGECLGDEAAAWLSDILQRDCRLVRSHVSFTRRIAPQAAHMMLPVQQRYPNAGPINILGQASLDDLNRRAGVELEVQRFRPNFVIEGAENYAEDSWKRVKIGELVLEYMGPCERCGVTLVAPGTDERGHEPLLTLRTYRKIETGFANGLIFSAFYKPLAPGKVRRGDKVEVLEQGPPPVFSI